MRADGHKGMTLAHLAESGANQAPSSDSQAETEESAPVQFRLFDIMGAEKDALVPAEPMQSPVEVIAAEPRPTIAAAEAFAEAFEIEAPQADADEPEPAGVEAFAAEPAGIEPATIEPATSEPVPATVVPQNRAAEPEPAAPGIEPPVPAPRRAPIARSVETAPTGSPFFPDLARNIGSATWFRGVATLTLLVGGAFMVWPGAQPIMATPLTALDQAERDEYRSQMVMPLAFGADSGRRMAATDAVVALNSTPERPQIELAATFGRGDSFMRVLQRAGVGQGDASKVASLLSNVVDVDRLTPGTRLDVILGRRASRTQPRPLEEIAFRARFDLNVSVSRMAGDLVLTREQIRVDDTPLRITGTVGSSLYRSARAAGAPAEAVEAFLRTLATRMSVSRDIAATDEFDLVVDYKRAETGEVELGKLLYASIRRDGQPRAELMRWTAGGRDQWFDSKGVGEERGVFARPVNGSASSGYGMRRHPILGYRRMHSGMDYRASYGSPIYAVADGTVSYAGRNGGYGRYVRINHAGNIGSGYAHMSRIAVSSGARVRKGQIIGYVGSTGLSTGPHLHFELYRGGAKVNPSTMDYTTRVTLTGSERRQFENRMALVKRVAPGAALEPLASTRPVEPQREIERLRPRET